MRIFDSSGKSEGLATGDLSFKSSIKMYEGYLTWGAGREEKRDIGILPEEVTLELKPRG